METQEKIKTGDKVAYEKPKNEFRIGIVNDINNGKALVNSRWCLLSNLNIVTQERDLFDYYDELPDEVQRVVEFMADIQSKYGLDYEDCKEFNRICKELGYTFEYDLSSEPFNLKKIEI